MDVKICLIGKGIVGSSLIQLLEAKKKYFKQEFKLNFIVNSIFEKDGALLSQNLLVCRFLGSFFLSSFQTLFQSIDSIFII